MKKIFTILALLLVQNSYALELHATDGVEILALNGKTVNSSLFKTTKTPEVEPGNHQIVVRYSRRFSTGQLVRSRPAIFNLDLQQDTTISVQDLNTEYKAEKAVRQGLDWEITSKNNSYTVTDSDILVDNGFLPYSDMEGVIALYNQQNNITTAAVATATTAAVVAPAVSSNPTPITPNVMATSSDMGTTLQTLYQLASKEDKKQFRMWLIEQDMK